MTTEKSDQEKHHSLEWRGKAPVSRQFDDVYYSADDGLAETQFVFLEGIGAPACWLESDHYVIAETGFGTGLNFLATWQAWRQSGANGRLTFISAEGYPLPHDALVEAHQSFPELADLASDLRLAWPPNATGFHPRSFDDGKVRLILLFGDATRSFTRLHASVDAWYLDGFAPAKNPAMWSDALMDQVARLSQPGTRFATFTAAGFVKRALLARGFDVRKAPGFGRKRERLLGIAETPNALTESTAYRPEWAPIKPAPDGKIAVIGGGIGGAAVAAALTERGRDVTLFDDGAPAAASNVPAAILAPRFVLEHSAASEIFTSAYALSCAFPAYEHAWSETKGVIVRPKNERDAARLQTIPKYLGWPPDWLCPEGDGYRLEKGGSLDPQTGLAALKAKTLNVVRGHIDRITAPSESSAPWQLIADDETVYSADIVIVAAGVNSSQLLTAADCPEIRPNHGQVERISSSDFNDWPETSTAFGGYITADLNGEHTIGSTFTPSPSLEAEPTQDARIKILETLKTCTGLTPPHGSQLRSWAGVRATTPDHLPYAGPVADGTLLRSQFAPLSKDAGKTNLGAAPVVERLYLLSGLGSKGFQYGPLMAEYLAAQICGDPLPLPIDAVSLVHPARDLIRKVKRRHPLAVDTETDQDKL